MKKVVHDRDTTNARQRRAAGRVIQKKGRRGEGTSGNQVFLPRLSLSLGAAGVEEGGGGGVIDGGSSAGALALKLCVVQESSDGRSGGMEKGWSVMRARESERERERRRERNAQARGEVVDRARGSHTESHRTRLGR